MAVIVPALLCLLFAAPLTAVQFSDVVVMGRVSDSAPDEVSGLAASRRHPGILYGLNDHGSRNYVFAFDPVTGDLKATLEIDGATNRDWEDICVGLCGQGQSETCIYIADIGDNTGDHPKTIYKVAEPSSLQDAIFPVLDTYKFRWDEDDAESLMIDPDTNLYVISKAHHGDALFARLPATGWGSAHSVSIPSHATASLALSTSHNDPQGADFSPDGRWLLVKTEEDVLFYSFSSRNYVSEIAGLIPQTVSTYVRRRSGESVAWNVEGTGFYTLPEGHHPVFNYYTVTENLIG